MAPSATLKWPRVLLLTVLLLASSTTRRARADLTLDRYVAAPVASDGFALSRPDALGHLKVGAQLQLDYARNPLVWEAELGDANTVGAQIAQSHLVGHAIGSLSVYDRALFFVHLPLNLIMSGDRMSPIRADGAGLGNLRLGGRVNLFGKYDGIFALGLQASLGLPSSSVGRSAQLSGESKPTGHIGLLADVRPGRAHITANVGARFRHARVLQTLEVSQELTFALGAGYEFLQGPTRLEILAEAFGSTAFSRFAAREESPIEFLGGAKLRRVEGFSLGAAAGAGLTHGVGAPDFRVVGVLGFLAPAARDRDRDGLADPLDRCVDAPEDRDTFQDDDGCPDPDNDADGIADARDECPNEKEDVDGFQDDDGCPDQDNDADTILDAADSCPLEAEDEDGFADDDGCPDPDNDGDGALDGKDECPSEVEDQDAFQDEDGCPDPDNDGDGILDTADECPLEAETINQRDDEDGCPDRIRVDRANGQIQILEPVRFATGSAIILAASFEMLGEIAEVLKSHPEIARLGVEGHTDARGNDAKNQKLSEDRASSVRDFLVTSGVAEGRIVARGFGETQPAADNKTEAGRTKNRRVEFHIEAPTEPAQ